MPVLQKQLADARGSKQLQSRVRKQAVRMYFRHRLLSEKHDDSRIAHRGVMAGELHATAVLIDAIRSEGIAPLIAGEQEMVKLRG